MFLIALIASFLWMAYIWLLAGNILGVILNVFAAGVVLRGKAELHKVETRKNPYLTAFERGMQQHRDEHKN